MVPTRNVYVGHGCSPMTKSHNSCKTWSSAKSRIYGHLHVMLVTVYRYEQNPAMDVGGVVAHTIFRVVVRTEKCTYKCPPTIVWGA